MAKNRPPTRGGSGGTPRRPSYGSGGGKGGGTRPSAGGTGGGGGNYTGGTRHKGGESSCSMWAPVAVALLPYALLRMALDARKGARRGRDAS